MDAGSDYCNTTAVKLIFRQTSASTFAFVNHQSAQGRKKHQSGNALWCSNF
jgi:hypothetical protein